MSFSKIFQIHFIVDSTFIFFFILVCLNNSWWSFSLSFSSFEDRRRVFSQSCSILFKIRDSSWLPSSHNYFRLWEFFSAIRSNSRVFSVWLSGAHHLRFVHSQLSALIIQTLPVHHSIFSNQLVISSFQLYLNSLKYLRSFHNSSRCSFIFSSFIFISYGGSSKFLFLINLFIVNPTGGSWRPSQVCDMSLLNPFQGE